ncbi:MAG: AlpA family phage regulatory protein [Candidatus Thiodiazotropha taylori]|nr:AlpA family phage regulatory protein [Candidatus Thiodiazotropha taylori]
MFNARSVLDAIELPSSTKASKPVHEPAIPSSQSTTYEHLQTQGLLTIKELQRLLGGKSRSTIYRWLEQGRLPQPIRFGPNSIGWPVEVINAWLEDLLNGHTTGEMS